MKHRALLAVLLVAVLLVVALSAHAGIRPRPAEVIPGPPGGPGYYVLALVLSIQPELTPAPRYQLVRLDEGPYDWPTASARLDVIGTKGLRQGAEFYPVHLVQKAWIYYRCDGCELE